MPVEPDLPDIFAAPDEGEASPARKRSFQSAEEDWLWMSATDPAFLLKSTGRETGRAEKT